MAKKREKELINAMGIKYANGRKLIIHEKNTANN